MSKSLNWRGVIALFTILAAVIYLVPSLTDGVPGWWSSLLPKDKIHLGLDLQGGMHLVLEVQASKAVENHLERVVEELKRDLRKDRVRYLELKRNGLDGIEIILMRPDDKGVFLDMVSSGHPDFKAESIPDKEGKPAFQLVLDPKAKIRIMKMAVDQALETIRNRIDQFGVSEPDIRPQEDSRLLIQLPGIKDPKRAIALIGKTALLEFKLVDE
ncbi:MAG: protein translocase subunit SecD, partial [Desulfobacteraceae bacterium]|nr:protein translocase subunit SecD [Desulfobacteraceae bacterium]